MQEKLIFTIEDINDYDTTLDTILKVMNKIIMFYTETGNLYRFITSMLQFFYIIYVGIKEMEEKNEV